MNEVMMWLANYNTQPRSYNYAANGHAIAIATDIKIAGYTWNLYHGEKNWQVWTFIPSNGGPITDFTGNINLFLKYLTSHGHIQSYQYLTTAQAGTEATRGDADLTTYAYNLKIE
jgi:xyloglucan-specific endo-beta-1,4-glucanase